jgi:uncharacterized repeat protein (TIGR03803 family)
MHRYYRREFFVFTLALSTILLPTHLSAREHIEVLYSFPQNDGSVRVTSGLVSDSVGDLFGTISGLDADTPGTVFRVAPDGNGTTLHIFSGGSDGSGGIPDLIIDASGNLYGAASGGGSACDCGILFKLSPEGTETILHVFSGGSDGKYPNGPLTADAAGNLYGTSASGGDAGEGTVFRLSPNGTLNVLHSFAGGNDGQAPLGKLVADSAGNLYGITYRGGNGCEIEGCGTVYRVSQTGAYSILHAFEYGSDGAFPLGGLVTDNEGDLYGVAVLGGPNNRACEAGTCGTVFQIAPSGTLTTLHAFKGGEDGEQPNGLPLWNEATATLYGTTVIGGNGKTKGGGGVVYALTVKQPRPREKVLHRFHGKKGAEPVGGLLEGGSGNFYGTAAYGGVYSSGTVFEVSP